MNESIHGERTADRLTELIEQRMAISEVLRAIANSPSDLQPIFDTIVANATRLCRAELGSLTLFKGNGYRVVSLRAAPVPYYAGWDQGRVFPVLPGSPRARLVESRSPVHVADMAAEPAYREFSRAKSFGARTLLLVPMLKEDELIGAIGIARTQVQPFTDAQIDLITDFAAQATVALESTRRERQYREMQSELAHANRITTMGQLTASIVHEVKQPITATATNAEAALRWLDRQPPNLEEARQMLADIVKDSHRAGDVIDRMRDLIKKAPPRKDRVEINGAIREVIELTYSEAVKNGVSVQTQFAESLPLIQGDRVQLQQVMLNLIINAIQAMSGLAAGIRELRITTENTESEGVRLAVRDSGPGLSSENFQRLFEPFYTTKPEGMGIGLSICRSIIEAHGGRLWAIPCEPQGALFQFTIPAT